MANAATISIDDIAPMGSDPLALGTHGARLQSVEGRLSKKDKPMVVATFITDKGEEANIFYSLSTTVSQKNGRTYARGIDDMAKAFKNVGKPLPKGYAFPLDEDIAAKLYAKHLKGAHVTISVREEKDYQDPTKTFRRISVVGLHEGSALAAGSGDFAWDENEAE